MAIAAYLREMGRGRDGARALPHAHAKDLMGQLLDGVVSDVEVGAFCAAMRIKGETPEEMSGFLDALHERLPDWSCTAPTVVIPSYNGARRLPVLTPLLAGLLAREGLAVLLHGTSTEDRRVSSESVLRELRWPVLDAPREIAAGEVAFIPTGHLHAGLQRLLAVRRQIGLRNSAHSLVKLLQPLRGPALLVSSYTHPEYATSMADTLSRQGTRALLLRGLEGEPVADPRRQPAIDAFVHGQRHALVTAQTGPLTELPFLPTTVQADATAAYTAAVLAGEQPVPAPIAAQVRAVLHTFQL